MILILSVVLMIVLVTQMQAPPTPPTTPTIHASRPVTWAIISSWFRK